MSEGVMVLTSATITAAWFWGDLLRMPHYDWYSLAMRVETGATDSAAAETMGLSVSDAQLVRARRSAGLTEDRLWTFERVLAVLIHEAVKRAGSVEVAQSWEPQSGDLLVRAAAGAGFDATACRFFPYPLCTKVSSDSVAVSGSHYLDGRCAPLIESF